MSLRPRDLLLPLGAAASVLRAASWRTAGLAFAWLLLAGLLLGVAAAVTELGWDLARGSLAAEVFPEGARPLAETAVTVLFAEDLAALRGQLTVTVGLMLLALLGFPLKEAVGRSVEADLARRAGLPAPAFRDLPLWREAVSEAAFLGLSLGLQAALLLLSVSGDVVLGRLAFVLAHAVLVVTLAVDALAPALFRRERAYSAVFALVARRPLAPLVLGLALAAPLWLGPALLPRVGPAAVASSLALQAGVILVSLLVGAATARRLLGGDGTAAEDLPTRPRPLLALGATLTVAAVLAFALPFALGLLRSLAHKLPALRCDWSADLASLRVDLPDIAPLAVLSDQPLALEVSLDVTVRNPTDRPLAVEPLRLEVSDGDQVLAETAIAAFEVAAGASRTLPLALTLSLRPTAFLHGASPDPRSWAIALALPLDGGRTLRWPLHTP